MSDGPRHRLGGGRVVTTYTGARHEAGLEDDDVGLVVDMSLELVGVEDREF